MTKILKIGKRVICLTMVMLLMIACLPLNVFADRPNIVFINNSVNSSGKGSNVIIVKDAPEEPKAKSADDAVDYVAVDYAATDCVAKIGDTEYANFAKALADANAMTGDVTVEIYGEVEFVDSMELKGNYASIRFVGQAEGAKMTINQSAGGDYLEAHGKTVAFEGLILAKANPAWSGNSGHMGNYFSIQGGTVTYTNCTFPNGACTSGGTATYTDCTFRNASEYGLWVYDDALVTVNKGTIDSKKGIKVYSEGETSVTSTLTVENTTFTENVTAKPAVAIGYAESITLIGNTYNNTTGVLELDSGTDADCEGITFVAQDANGNDISSTLTAVDRSNSNARCGVLVDGKIYTTVTEAAKDAVSGDTVTLLYDSTETVELAYGVELKANGFNAANVTVQPPVAKVGEEEFLSVLEALNYAIQNNISVVELCRDSREVMPTDVELLLKADLKIVSATGASVTAKFYNNGTSYDFIFNSASATPGYTLTIGENVTFQLEDRVIWAGYYGNNVDVVVEGTLAGYQYWLGADTTVKATGTLRTTGEALVMRRGATLTVNGGKVNANYFSILSGNIVAENATITSGPIWVSNTSGYAGEGSVSIDLNNGTKWTSTGNIKLNTDNAIEVNLTNSTLSATGTEYGASVVDAKSSITVDADSQLGLNKLTGEGTLTVDLTGMEAGAQPITGNVSGFNVVLTGNEDMKLVYDENGNITIQEKVYVAQVGDVKFESLADAIAAVANGGTVTLLADVTEDVTIEKDVEFTLDLGGYTLNGCVNISEGTLTVQNGYVVSETYALNASGTANVTIKSGTFTGKTAAVYVQTGATVSIKGGDFTGALSVDGGKLKVYAGVFDAEVDSDYIALGYACVDNGNGTYRVKSAIEAKVGDEAYATLAEAIAAAKPGETILLQANVDINTVISITKDLTIADYGTYTITFAEGAGLVVGENASLTLDNILSIGGISDVTAYNATPNYFIVVDGANASVTLTEVNTNGAIYVSADADGSTIDADGKKVVLAAGAEGIKIANAEIEGAVAKIGENTYYSTLAGALEAAKGEKNIAIELVADATLDITAWQTLAIGGDTTETITIDGKGYTLTFNKLNSDWNHIATNNDATLILKNMTITDSGYNNGPWNRYDLNFGCDVELENVTATKAVAFKAGAKLTNVTINETEDAYAIWIQPNGQDVEIKGLTVTSAGRGIKIDDQYIDAPAKVTLAIENAEFTTAKKAAILVKSTAGAVITAENVDISNVAADSGTLVWVDADAAEHYNKVTVNDAPAGQEDLDDFKAAFVDTNGNVIGYYKTLQAAINAAKNGDVIKLIADCAENVTVVQAPGVVFTIDGNDKTMSGTITIDGKSAAYATAGLTITEVNFKAASLNSDAFINLGKEGDNNTRYTSNVTVTNCTFTYDGDGINENIVAIKNYTGGCKNLTVTGCTANGMHSMIQVKGVANLAVSEVEITNCKNGISVGTSTGVTITGADITATGYGVRADGSDAYNLTVKDSTIEADLPVVVRKNTADGYKLTLEGNNNLTGTNGEGYKVIFTAGDDGTYDTPTVGVVVNGNTADVFPVFQVKIDDSYYATLADAIAAAQAGDTIVLLADITASDVILIDRSLTINGNGHKITSSASRVIRVTTSNVEVTLNNVNMVSEAVRVGTNDIRGISIDILENVTLTLNNCSVDFTDASANDWAYAVNVTGGSKHCLTVNDGTYEGANVINVHGTQNSVTVKDATLTSLYPNNDIYYGACIWVLQNQGSSVEATGNTFEGANTVVFNLGTGTTLTESNNTDNTTRVMAKIGNTYYTSLADAIEAVKTGETITILHNITIAEGETVVINGFNFVVNDGVNFTNNGIIYVTGTSDIAATVTGSGWVYMNGVTLSADTKLDGAKVGFINGTNKVVGSTITNGFFSVGIGQNDDAAAANAFATANGITLGNVTVNVSGDAVIGGNGATYSGWVGSAYSADKTQYKYVLNVENSLATFGYMHVSKDGTLNVKGHANNKYTNDNANVDFYAGDFIINGTVTLDGTDAWVRTAKISADHADAVLNIINGTNCEMSRHNGATTGDAFKFYNAGTVNVDATSKVEIDNVTTFVDGAKLNIAGKVTAKGTVTGNSTITLTDTSAAFTAAEGLTVNTGVEKYVVVYTNGTYSLAKVVATIGNTPYTTVADALAAAKDGETITLVSGDTVISMAGSVVGNKTVTITGSAIVDWTQGNLFIGRGGEGNGKVIFENATITSSVKKNPASTGIHVSGSKASDVNTNDGILEIKNSTIELDYLINRNEVLVSANSTLTVYGGCYTHGRDASESADGTAKTATLTIESGSTVIVVNENGMGVGGESNGIMNVQGTYKANVLNVSNIGVVNVEGGVLDIEGKVTNKGTIKFTDVSLTDITIEGTGKTYFYNKINFYGNNSITTEIDGAPFELIVNKDATLFITRFVLGYNRAITVYGNIEDAHSFDPAGKTPSLKFNSTSGVSVGGTDTGKLTVQDAYVELGNSSWKNASGTYTWTFENSYVSATSFTNNNAPGADSAAWTVTFDDSVLVAKNYIKNGANTTYNFINGSVATTGSLRIDGVLYIDETSSVTTTSQQNNVVGGVDEHGGINGTVNVEGQLTIGSNANTQLEILGGELNITGNGKVDLGDNKLTLDSESKLTIDVVGIVNGEYVGITGNVESNGSIEVKENLELYVVVEDGKLIIKDNYAIIDGKGYPTFEDALAAAQKAAQGNPDIVTITLVENVSVTGTLVLTDGISIDLNGYTLEADYFVAFKGNTITGEGSLKVAKDNAVFATEQTVENMGSAYMPVYMNGEYVFKSVSMKAQINREDGLQIVYVPEFDTAWEQELAEALGDSGLQFVVRISWDKDDEGNYVRCQEFIFNSNLAYDVYKNRNAFSLRVGALADVEDLNVEIILRSDTGFEVSATVKETN